MQRLLTGFILLATLTLLGCGGRSSSPLPDNSGNPPANPAPGNPAGEQALLDVQAPDFVSGSRGTTQLPGQLNILTGVAEDALPAVLDKFGYTLLRYKDGRATVQVPVGQEDLAAATLTKEYNIATAERVNVLNMPSTGYNLETLRNTSFYPPIPFYSDNVTAFNFDGTNVSFASFIGQGQPMNFQGFNTAWDLSLSPAVAAQPVSIAIISAGYWDFSVTDQPGFDEAARIDPTNTGFVAGDGTFTAGLTAAAWELFDHDGDPNSPSIPFEIYGNLILGVLAADPGEFIPRGFDLNGDTVIGTDEVWNEGIAGVNPNANYILVKTGTAGATTWSYTDNEIAASIDHAVAAGANIVVLGMFANGPVGGVVSTAIQNARDTDVLVVAPAGDVVASFNGTGFDETPVDIQVTPVTPASDVNVVSVAGTGFNRQNGLGTVDFGDGPIDNLGTGYSPRFNPPFDSLISEVASYSNTGASIAGVGFGMGFGQRPFLQGPGPPPTILPGFNYGFFIDRFSTVYSAAYVAGAASQVFQILSEVNGVPPTDDEVLSELISTVQFPGLAGTQSGLLNAGFAATSAINGGTLNQVLPALEFTSVILSQNTQAITRGTDVSVTATVINGTAPFELTVDWGNGDAPTVIPNWTNGTPETLAGGYQTLGNKGLTVTVEDANGIVVTASAQLRVINPLAANITVSRADGSTIQPQQLRDGTTYRFNSNATNVFTGDGNTTTFEWDFDDNGTVDATGPAPTFQYPLLPGGAQTFTVRLTVTETLRPNSEFTLDVTVSPNTGS